MAVATLGGRIYAVGGAGLRCVHRSLELFDRGAETWSLLGGELRTARKYTSVRHTQTGTSPVVSSAATA